MVAPFRKTKSLRSEDEEQDFQLVVKMTFLEYVPDRVLQRSRSCSAPATCKNNSSAVQGSSASGGFSRELSEDSVTGSTDTADTSPSLGSTLHQFGTCKPCAWFWKSSGCNNGAQCRHCHLCPFGELGRRKRQNRKLARSSRDAPVSDTSIEDLLTFSTESTEPISLEAAEGVEANPRRLVPRAQTWQGTTTATSQRNTYLRAQTWQHTVNLQTVPEGSLSSPVVLLLPVVANVLPTASPPSSTPNTPNTQSNSGP